MREPRWRPEIYAELRAHAAVPTEALVLQVFGLAADLHPEALFLHASRHWRQVGVHESATCPECAYVLRVHRWLVDQTDPLSVDLPYWTYASVRDAVGCRLRTDLAPSLSVPAFAARWRVATDREALVVFLWTARRVLAFTHAPGALTQLWHVAFAKTQHTRRQSLLHAWRGYLARREVDHET